MSLFASVNEDFEMSSVLAESSPLPVCSPYYEMVKWFCDNHTDHSETLSKIKTAEQLTTLGMAIENGSIYWDRGEGKQNFDSEMECLDSYFSAAWAEAFGSWL